MPLGASRGPREPIFGGRGSARPLDAFCETRKNRRVSTDGPRPSFATVSAELRKLGFIIRRYPGEYLINHRDGDEKTGRFAEDLAEALEIGRDMAAAREARRTSMRRRPKRRRRWRKQMTSKARRRRFIRAHNHRVRARAVRE